MISTELRPFLLFTEQRGVARGHAHHDGEEAARGSFFFVVVVILGGDDVIKKNKIKKENICFDQQRCCQDST